MCLADFKVCYTLKISCGETAFRIETGDNHPLTIWFYAEQVEAQ